MASPEAYISNRPEAAQKHQPFFADIESADTLARLFPDSQVKNKLILWKPNKSEKAVFDVMKDENGYCYSYRDFRLELQGTDVYLFLKTEKSNYSTDYFKSGSIIGVAHFKKSGNGFLLQSFRKYFFQFVMMDRHGFYTVSDLEIPSIVYRYQKRGNASDVSYEVFYDLKSFKKIITIKTHESNEFAVEPGAPYYKETHCYISNETKTSFDIITTIRWVTATGENKEESTTERVTVYDKKGNFNPVRKKIE